MKKLLLLLLLASPCWAEQQFVPFTLNSNNTINVEVTFYAPTGVLKRTCWLDTAATQLWVSDALAARLGLHSPWPEMKHPPMLTSYSVGTKRFSDTWVWNWHALNGESCLVGLDQVWGTYTTLDFHSRVITSADTPQEPWHSHWQACATTVYQLWDALHGK